MFHAKKNSGSYTNAHFVTFTRFTYNLMFQLAKCQAYVYASQLYQDKTICL